MTDSLSEQTFLTNYNIHDFDIPLVSVDVAIFTVLESQLQVLLVKRNQHPALGEWALPGGFIDLKHDQTLVAAAKRKLKEKTGVDAPHLEQVTTVGNPDRDPRGWSVTITYLALLASDDITLDTRSHAEEVAWHPVKPLNEQYTLAFDHNQWLQTCYQRLKSKVQYTSLPINLLAGTFTLTELQRIYEILLDAPLEKKAFRRRMLDADILQETGSMKASGSRPAKLYRVKPEGNNYFFSRNIEGPR